MHEPAKPIVLITGAAGKIGSALVRSLKADYRVVALDRNETDTTDDAFVVDLTAEDSLAEALAEFRARYGSRIASVVHLAAYFDFTGEPHPLYRKLNVEGTRMLLRALQEFEVEQFVFSGTMLVHEPCRPGERIDESQPIAPKWEYPASKAAAEEAIRESRGKIPVLMLRLAGVYDDSSAVPTLSQQIARIYERDLKSHLYSGDLRAGQSLIHLEDLADLVRRAVDRRHDLPVELALLAGEPDAVGYEDLQRTLGRLIHGADDWPTLELPKTLARVGAWAEEKAEPIIPDAFDRGEKPFIRPFMVDMADDHYALDIARARRHLGWEPQHRILDTLPKIVAALKQDPAGWYRGNGVTPPSWLEAAEPVADDLEQMRREHEEWYRRQHRAGLWAPLLNMGFGTWLITSPALLGYSSTWMTVSDMASGALVILFSFIALDWRFAWARWATAAIGGWVMFAPLALWAPEATAYLNGTLVGAIVTALAVLVRPAPGVAPQAAVTGPDIPPGWDFNPSMWLQRLPIIVLAFVGLYISRYLTAYQLGYIDGVWDPFFVGNTAEKNGTEEIVTSSVSEAWPVPDAGLGALVYALEILTGIAGSTRRWRTMPWLVTLFGFLIVPLGVVSITFIVIQPIVIGTWCTLCLVAAAAMLLQVPYSLDELVATGGFLMRRKRAGRPILRVFLFGDTEEGGSHGSEDEFAQGPAAFVRNMVSGGVGVPWNLALSVAIGVWLMFTRVTLGAEGWMANADHLVGSLVVTVSVISFAEIARPVRYLNIPFGAALVVMPFVFGADPVATVASMVCGIALILLSLRRGPVRRQYGRWSRHLV